jgi:hypothetical protein
MIGGQDDDQILVHEVDQKKMSAHLCMLQVQEGPLYRVFHRDGAEGEKSQEESWSVAIQRRSREHTEVRTSDAQKRNKLEKMRFSND